MNITDFLNRYGNGSTSNFQLLDWSKQLGIPKLYVRMANELGDLVRLKRKTNKPLYIICNYQSTKDIGTHWTALYKYKDNAYFFDPYGIQPFPEAKNFLESGVYSTFRIQPDGSKMCGVLCLFVLYRLSKGDDFYDVVLKLNDDIEKLQ